MSEPLEHFCPWCHKTYACPDAGREYPGCINERSFMCGECARNPPPVKNYSGEARWRMIDSAAVVVDAGGACFCPGSLGLLVEGLRAKCVDLKEARIVSRRALREQFEQSCPPDVADETAGARCHETGVAFAHGLPWGCDETLPADIVLLETGRAHGVVKNCCTA